MTTHLLLHICQQNCQIKKGYCIGYTTSYQFVSSVFTARINHKELVMGNFDMDQVCVISSSNNAYPCSIQASTIILYYENVFFVDF